jgi:hypothetical protein
MRSILLITLSVLLFTSISVSCFTNGTLLPGYMCGPPNDGLPKSLGGVLPFFVLATNPLLTPQPMDGKMKAHDRPLDAGNGGTIVNTRTILAGFHSAALDIPPLVPFKKVVKIIITAIDGAAGAGTNDIISGLDHHLQIQSTPADLGVFADDVALDGTLVFAVDKNQNRVGSFKATGPHMTIWPYCNIHNNNPNAGAIHHQLLSDNGHYDGLIWTAPTNMVGQTIEFKGAAVTDDGYGAHSTVFNVVAPPAAAPQIPTIKSLVYSMANSLLFFVDNGTPAANDVATDFIVTITDKNTGNKLGAPINTKASPLMFNLDILVRAGAATGHIIDVTVMAKNGQGTSTASTPIMVTGGTFASGKFA